MVNKCVAFGCKSGYVDTRTESVSSFCLPYGKKELLKAWIKFVNRVNWSPSVNSVICSKHFEKQFLHLGKRTKLNWSLNPIPSIHTVPALKRPSTLQTLQVPRKAPKIRVYQEDQLESFSKNDIIKDFMIYFKSNALLVICFVKQTTLYITIYALTEKWLFFCKAGN